MKNQMFSLKSNFSNGMVIIILLITISLALSGCGATKAVKMNQAAMKEAYQIQKPIVVRTSLDDDRPQWTQNTVFEKNGKVYFTGGFTDGADYAVTIRCANAEALKTAVQAIAQYIRAEFSEYVQGSNSVAGDGIDRYFSDGIATFSENIHVQGIRQAEIYYEEMFSPAGMQPTYNVFVKLEMSKADYLHAKASVLIKLRDRFKDEGEFQAKEKAEKLLEDLKNEIRTQT
jgi:hypothetical protein